MTVSGEVITSDPEPASDSTLNEIQGEDKPLLSPASSTPETISAGISNYWDSIILTICCILYNKISNKKICRFTKSR